MLSNIINTYKLRTQMIFYNRKEFILERSDFLNDFYKTLTILCVPLFRIPFVVGEGLIIQCRA